MVTPTYGNQKHTKTLLTSTSQEETWETDGRFNTDVSFLDTFVQNVRKMAIVRPTLDLGQLYLDYFLYHQQKISVRLENIQIWRLSSMILPPMKLL